MKTDIEELKERAGSQGTHIIEYRDMLVGAPLHEIEDVMRTLLEYSRSDRRELMRSVNRALDIAHPKAKQNIMTGKDYLYFCQDVAIWFANEVNEGRVRMDDSSVH